VVCCGGTIFGGIWTFGTIKKVSQGIGSCTINTKSMHTALRAYSDKNNGELPSAETWQDDLAPLFKSALGKMSERERAQAEEWVKSWQPDGEWSCVDSNNQKTGFCFNTAFSKKKISDLKPSDPIIFETKTIQRNASSPYKALPFSESPFAIMSERRGWIVVGTLDVSTVSRNGSLKSIGNGSGTNFDFDASDSSESSNQAPANSQDY
jgi:hypothetical protein